jgi:hypothetical protein
VKSVLEEISRRLAQIGTTGSFATRRTAAAGDLNLKVQDVGSIRLPVTKSTARRLCEIARAARHGFKDETRLDRRIRDTWEIPKSRISIDEPRWMRTLTAQLGRIRRDLGLPEECPLKARLHNMLVYAPGQFFVPHQDSEKTDNMIGTLVVSLPSRFSGGAMVIKHHDEKMLVGGSNNRLTFVAFYADCYHEVRPIRQGHRIVLTYNLIVEGGATAADAPASQIEPVAQSIRKFFETPRPPRWSGDLRQGPPDRLVYLLDHEYTQRGLAWNRLKNADAHRAAALQKVARQLECEIFIALADVHETWSCEEEYPDYGGYGRRSRWNYNDDENDDESENESFEPELTELIDSDIELRHWIGAGGRREAAAGSVDADELSYTKPSVELEPFESEHEGYMGNWGNTVEHWYHRAAVVLWPRERTFIIRAKASPLWGIGEVAKTLKAGNPAEASALAQRLLPFWPQVAGRAGGRGLLDATLKVAAKLDDPTVAAILLRPFALIGLTPKAMPRLANLLDSYGLDWCRTLLRNWESERAHESLEGRLSWMGSVLPALCQSLCVRDSSDGRSLARWILTEQWAWLLDRSKQLRKCISEKQRSKELSRLCKPILRLMESSRIARQPDLHAQMIEFLTGGTIDLPVHVALGLLQAAHEHRQPGTLRSLGLKPVHMHCTQDLTTRLNAPVRSNDDWSIATSVRCSCKLCTTLFRYLHAHDKVQFEWPLAKRERAHIHGIVESYNLPVTHMTRRTGRPFTLMLEKTAAVFERDAVERRLWQSALQWLTKTVADF